MFLLACSWLVAFLLVLLLNHAFSGPRLGSLYDLLLDLRPSPPVSSQILIIETENAVEPGDVFSILMTLGEMGAAGLVVEAPVLGTGGGTANSGAAFAKMIDSEFGLVQKNTRSLFDAIRLGLIEPEESQDYIESVADFAEKGRRRLNAAAMGLDEAWDLRLAQAFAVFGRAVQAGDTNGNTGVQDAEISVYSKTRADSDGVTRRIAPLRPPGGLSFGDFFGPMQDDLEPEVPLPVVLPVFRESENGIQEENIAFREHSIYKALRHRWTQSSIEINGTGATLTVKTLNTDGQISGMRFPLDKSGSIFFEKPGKNDSFRSLGIAAFLDYERGGREMVNLLQDAQSLGLFEETRPERIPLVLFEHSQNLMEQLLESPQQDMGLWLAARRDYMASLGEYLYGPAEMRIRTKLETEIAGTGKKGGGVELDGLVQRRNAVTAAFSAMRETYSGFTANRLVLSAALREAFCIMPAKQETGSGGDPASALLANTLLTGRSISPAGNLDTVLWSLSVSLLALALVHILGSRAVLLKGSAVSLLCLAGFSLAFIISGYWINPAIPAAAVFGGTLFLCVSRFCITHLRLLRFYRETAGRR